MPSATEIVEEARKMRDFLEQRWNLPWYSDRASAPIWRHRFVHLLAHLPDELFDDTMRKLLSESSFALKGVALHLVRMRDRAAFADEAMDLLEDRSLHVRALAAAALGQFATEEALEALLETKDGEHPEVKKAVVDALARIRDARCIPLLARWVGRAGEDDELRRKACEALGSIADDAAMPVLSRVLEDETAIDEVRGEAARALGRIGGAEARALLLKGLRSDRPWVRAACAQALSFLGDPALLEQVLPLLGQDQPWMVRSHAVEAVGRLGGSAAVAHLGPLIQDSEAQIRSATCVALGLIGSREAGDLLRMLLRDREVGVQAQALAAMSRIADEDFGFKVEDHRGAVDLRALRDAVQRALAWRPAGLPPA